MAAGVGTGEAEAVSGTRGLIIGKFYPPHRGHQFLIETALAQTDQLTIIVCDQASEAPSATLREAWLRELYPTTTVLRFDDTYNPDDSALWARLVRGWLGYTPEVVFTSEDYGERFAFCLGCKHVCVDRPRAAVPISGTQIRANPYAHWAELPAPVRGYYCRRVVLVGAESTGKTTLTTALAAEFDTVWEPEYGREYWETKMAEGRENVWVPSEFETIARTQCDREDAAARRANRVLFCDTDAFATTIWYRRYLGERGRMVEQIAAAHRRPDLYFLTDVATPFEQDGTRDGEAIREWMHASFVAELHATGREYLFLSGPPEERLRVATLAVRAVLR